MKLDLNSQTLNVSFACRIEDAWVPVPETACTQSGFDWTLNGAHYSAQFTPAGDTLCYTLQMDAPNPTQLRMWLAVPGQSDYFHVIPCNIYGDNHAAEAKPGEFPLLTKDHHEVAFCAPLWEFRADRAAMPLAALCWDGGVAAAAVEPYSESEAGIIRNGVFAALPDAYNENSGLLNDLMAPNAAGSQVNGWWTGYGLVKDCHCAYTVGSAVHYLTKTMDYLHQNGKPCPAKWMDAAQKVLHTVMDLQRADGAFGYTYSTQERKVLDWSGFAGCWFAPALVYLYRLTGEERCLHSAEKALHYYHTFVKDLNCYGTPMDTWKAVDEEGNLAFMRGSRLLYEQTGKAEFLQYMKDSAGYEFLWRYGYKTYPEHTPLNQGWSACGGAVTSVSNPHIHPMGVIIDTDLRYLARVTGDGYYASRAADSAAWMLQCLELYPAATGYGRYGILSERWCPSDGLDVERFSDGRPFSSWFSHNLWASACVLEAACELLLESEHKKG